MAENKDYITSTLENGTVNINEDVITTIAAAAVKDVGGDRPERPDRHPQRRGVHDRPQGLERGRERERHHDVKSVIHRNGAPL